MARRKKLSRAQQMADRLAPAVEWVTHRKPDRDASDGVVRYGLLILALLTFAHTVMSNAQRDTLETARQEIRSACACCGTSTHEADR
jgi:hypothetical protein